MSHKSIFIGRTAAVLGKYCVIWSFYHVPIFSFSGGKIKLSLIVFLSAPYYNRDRQDGPLEIGSGKCFLRCAEDGLEMI